MRFNEKQMSTLASASSSPKRPACHFPQVEESLTREACRYFSGNVRVAVFGNSHATELAYSLASILKPRDIGVVHHAMSGCKHNYHIDSELDTVCGKWHSKVMKDLTSDKSIEVVILSYSNEGYLKESKYRKALADMANDLVASGKKVILVLQAPLPVSHINQHLSKHMADLSVSIPSRTLSDWKSLYADSNKMLELLESEVEVFDPVELFCDSENCHVAINGISLFFDNDHISVAGGNVIGAELVKRYLGGL